MRHLTLFALIAVLVTMLMLVACAGAETDDQTDSTVVVEKPQVADASVPTTHDRKRQMIAVDEVRAEAQTSYTSRMSGLEMYVSTDGGSDMGYAGGGIMMSAPAPQDNWNREGYAAIEENDFKAVSVEPLSTFSVDVDRASYANVRRYLNNSQLPPPGAVRIEEMINYFSYDYPQPTGDDPLAIVTEVATCPWNEAHQLVHIGLQAKQIDMERAPRSNLVFLLDVSGSMRNPNKLPLVKQSMRLLVDQMKPDDRVAIVVYAGAAGLVLPSTSGLEKQKILDSLDNLQAGGSTAGGAGIRLAYNTAVENLLPNGNNRVILCTDGDFNVGESSDAAMQELIEAKRDEGVFLTVLGFGQGNIQDSKMELLADKGNGNYGYIDDILEAKKMLVTEMGGTMFTVAKDVKVQVEFNPAQVKAYRLVGYENRMLAAQDFNDDTKDAGEMGAGHTVTALYELIPADSDEEIPGVDELRYQQTRPTSAARGSELLTVKFRYKEPDENTSKLIERRLEQRECEFINASNNFRFSAAVAEFGMLLRDSAYKGDLNYADVKRMARQSRGNDFNGYRGEFIRMIDKAELLESQRTGEPPAQAKPILQYQLAPEQRATD